jgi:hypothetical protein
LKRLVALVGLLACSLPAATVVAPNAYQSTEAPTFLRGVFENTAQTYQVQIAASQLSSVPLGAQLSGVGFRLFRMFTPAQTITLSYPDYNIELSTATNSIGSLSATFADNIGPDGTVVRSGGLTIPANSLIGGSNVNPFYIIPFSTDYTYLGGDLVLTLSYDSNGATEDFPVDAVPRGGTGDTDMAGSYEATTGGSDFYVQAVTEFTYNDSPAVPEPATCSLIGLAAALGVAWRARRWR